MTSPVVNSAALNGSIPTYSSGYAYRNLIANGAVSLKNNSGGVLRSQLVNTVGTTSSCSFYDGQSATVTMAVATPGVVTWNAHPFVAGNAVLFTTTGALLTGLTANTIYFVSITSLAANSFVVSDTQAHALAGTNNIAFSSTQSGVQTGYNVTNLIATLGTVALGNTTLEAQYGLGLVVVPAGAGAANLSIFYL